MDYKISKKAAAELTGLLTERDDQQLLCEIHRAKARGQEGDDQAFGKMLACKLRVLQADNTLCREFGILMAPVDKLEAQTADYFEMLRSWQKRNQSEVAA
jgi:hypothetical protein